MLPGILCQWTVLAELVLYKVLDVHESFIDIFEIFIITRVRASANTCLLGVAMHALGVGIF